MLGIDKVRKNELFWSGYDIIKSVGINKCKLAGDFCNKINTNHLFVAASPLVSLTWI